MKITIKIGSGKAVHLVHASTDGTVAPATLCSKITSLWNHGELVKAENFTRVDGPATCKTCLKP